MKPRRVIVEIEVETDMQIKELKEAVRDGLDGYGFEIKQISTNVIKKPNEKKTFGCQLA